MSGPPAQTPASVPNFDRLARLYRWMEYFSFGPFLWRCRIHFLPQLAQCRRALILGDGDGRFTAALLRSSPAVQIHAVDGSSRMIASLLRRAEPFRHRLRAEVADLRGWIPNDAGAKFDLVATHFFLDCLTTGEVLDLAERMGPELAPGALWLISEFAVPPSVFGRLIAAPVVILLYRAFRLLTGLRVQSLPEYGEAFAETGWSLKAARSHLGGLLVSQLWECQPE